MLNLHRRARVSTTAALAALSVVSTLTIAGSARADAPSYVRVRSVTAAGSGCPAGSTAVNVSPDGQALELIMDQFVAELGPNVSIAERYKSCQVNLDLDYPSGWSYSVESLDRAGYASLESGVRAQVQTTVYFQGSPEQAVLATTIYGPYDRDYLLRDTFGTPLWSPCGAQRSLNVKLALSLDASAAPEARGLITADGPDGGGQVFAPRLRWRRC